MLCRAAIAVTLCHSLSPLSVLGIFFSGCLLETDESNRRFFTNNVTSGRCKEISRRTHNAKRWTFRMQVQEALSPPLALSRHSSLECHTLGVYRSLFLSAGSRVSFLLRSTPVISRRGGTLVNRGTKESPTRFSSLVYFLFSFLLFFLCFFFLLILAHVVSKGWGTGNNRTWHIVCVCIYVRGMYYFNTVAT